MTKPDLMAELAEVVRLSESATPGPWRDYQNGGDGDSCGVSAKGSGDVADCWMNFYRDETEIRANAELIARAVNFLRTHHAELEELSRDKERLDWLEGGNERTIFQCIGGEWCAHDGTPGVEHFGSTPRDAIDAAIDHAMHNSAREE